MLPQTMLGHGTVRLSSQEGRVVSFCTCACCNSAAVVRQGCQVSVLLDKLCNNLITLVTPVRHEHTSSAQQHSVTMGFTMRYDGQCNHDAVSLSSVSRSFCCSCNPNRNHETAYKKCGHVGTR